MIPTLISLKGGLKHYHYIFVLYGFKCHLVFFVKPFDITFNSLSACKTLFQIEIMGLVKSSKRQAKKEITQTNHSQMESIIL